MLDLSRLNALDSVKHGFRNRTQALGAGGDGDIRSFVSDTINVVVRNQYSPFVTQKRDKENVYLLVDRGDNRGRTCAKHLFHFAFLCQLRQLGHCHLALRNDKVRLG